MPIETAIQDGKLLASIDSLKNWAKNPRGVKKDDFERLIRQLSKHKQNKPLLVDANTGEVLGGNMRLRAYKQMGVKFIWVSLVTPKDEAEQIELALADNDNVGYYEEDRLADLVLPHREAIDLKTYKVDLSEPKDLSLVLDKYAPTEEDNFDVDAELAGIDEPTSALGEVYELGPHRLMCGDATNKEHMDKLMGDTFADLLFTDPPYGVSYGKKNEHLNKSDRGRREESSIEGDDMSPGDTRNLVADAMKVAPLKKGGVFYICSPAGDMETEFRLAIMDADYMLKQCLVWMKQHFVMGRQDYQWKHESILYGWKRGASHTFYGGRTQSTIWEIDRPMRSRSHPTMKPVRLIIKAIYNSSEQGHKVLDMFGGSGSTLIACEQTKRQAFIMELDPKYCDVIIRRYERYIEASTSKGD